VSELRELKGEERKKAEELDNAFTARGEAIEGSGKVKI